jgi:hypothetical protein
MIETAVLFGAAAGKMKAVGSFAAPSRLLLCFAATPTADPRRLPDPTGPTRRFDFLDAASGNRSNAHSIQAAGD